MSATETAGPIQNADHARIASLQIANRSLTKRNGELAAKTRQASDWFNELAMRVYFGQPQPPVASLEACATYFYDTGKFLPDLKPFIEPADIPAGGENS